MNTSSGYEGRDGKIPHPFSDGESLKSKVLRVFEEEVAEVEYRPEPVVLRCVEVRACSNSEECRTSEGCLVHKLNPVEDW